MQDLWNYSEGLFCGSTTDRKWGDVGCNGEVGGMIEFGRLVAWRDWWPFDAISRTGAKRAYFSIEFQRYLISPVAMHS